jgi:predicted  nucleic acid-binding Zn-ribbon protein
MKTYCPDCGTKMEYTAKKPKFCIDCGYAFAGVPKQQKANYQKSIEAEEDDDIPVNLPNIQGLEVELEVDRPTGFEFGSLIGTSSPPRAEDFPKPDLKDQASSKEFLADFLKEAGTSRKHE